MKVPVRDSVKCRIDEAVCRGTESWFLFWQRKKVPTVFDVIPKRFRRVHKERFPRDSFVCDVNSHVGPFFYSCVCDSHERVPVSYMVHITRNLIAVDAKLIVVHFSSSTVTWITIVPSEAIACRSRWYACCPQTRLFAIYQLDFDLFVRSTEVQS